MLDSDTFFGEALKQEVTAAQKAGCLAILKQTGCSGTTGFSWIQEALGEMNS